MDVSGHAQRRSSIYYLWNSVPKTGAGETDTRDSCGVRRTLSHGWKQVQLSVGVTFFG